MRKIRRKFDERWFLEGLPLYTRILSGLTAEDKSVYKKRFDISDDYDDYWFFRKYWKNDLSPAKQLQYLDFKTYLPEFLLTKVDRVAMAQSLETRVPFLDRELCEYVFSLPENIIYCNGKLKGLLGNVSRGLIPDSVIDRTKQGFGLPLGKWKNNFARRDISFQEVIVSEFSKDPRLRNSYR